MGLDVGVLVFGVDRVPPPGLRSTVGLAQSLWYVPVSRGTPFSVKGGRGPGFSCGEPCSPCRRWPPVTVRVVTTTLSTTRTFSPDLLLVPPRPKTQVPFPVDPWESVSSLTPPPSLNHSLPLRLTAGDS